MQHQAYHLSFFSRDVTLEIVNDGRSRYSPILSVNCLCSDRRVFLQGIRVVEQDDDAELVIPSGQPHVLFSAGFPIHTADAGDFDERLVGLIVDDLDLFVVTFLSENTE